MDSQENPGILEEKDVSKRTVLVLLVITIIVTSLGAWTVLDKMHETQQPKQATAQGQVSVNILTSPENQATANAVATP